MTEEAEKAKNWDMLQEYRAAQAQLSRLEHELQSIGKQWKGIAGFFEDCGYNSFKIDEERIRVLRPKPHSEVGVNEVGSLAFAAINIESLCRLLTDLEETKRVLGKLGEQLRAIGITNL
jgi:hypothetical protein